MQGYDPARFEPRPTDIFLCPNCQKIVRDPVDCQLCGQMYCWQCSPLYTSHNCVNNCPEKKFNKIVGALLKMHNNLTLKCSNPECNKLMQLVEIEAHEKNCLKIKCLNFENCQEYASQIDPHKSLRVCGNVCQLTMELSDSTTDLKTKYLAIQNFLKINQQDAPIKMPSLIQVNQQLANSQIVNLKWDHKKCGQGIAISNADTSVFLKESAYMFRTVLANQPFLGGVHYWEIEADVRTENELKIGVCSGDNINFNAAFCDQPKGFAYYGLAQLRNGSNASGQTYGKRFKKEGVLGICLNMNVGTLSFALNGEFMGVAFKTDLLKQGPLFAAVALLHCAGCTIKSGKQKPGYME